MNWQTIELQGYAYYSQKGYRILAPLVSNKAYDFVAEKDGEFIRVNVKTAGLKDKSQLDSWSISQSSGSGSGHTDNHGVDIYLTWLPKYKRFVEIDGGFLIGGNSKSKRIPKELLT